MAKTRAKLKAILEPDPVVGQVREMYKSVNTMKASSDETNVVRKRVENTAQVWKGPGHYMYEGRVHAVADCLDTPMSPHTLVSCQWFDSPPVCVELTKGFHMSMELTDRVDECPSAYHHPGSDGTGRAT